MTGYTCILVACAAGLVALAGLRVLTRGERAWAAAVSAVLAATGVAVGSGAPGPWDGADVRGGVGVAGIVVAAAAAGHVVARVRGTPTGAAAQGLVAGLVSPLAAVAAAAARERERGDPAGAAAAALAACACGATVLLVAAVLVDPDSAAASGTVAGAAAAVCVVGSLLSARGHTRGDAGPVVSVGRGVAFDGVLSAVCVAFFVAVAPVVSAAWGGGDRAAPLVAATVTGLAAAWAAAGSRIPGRTVQVVLGVAVAAAWVVAATTV